MSRALTASLALALVVGLALPARADQVVVADVTYEHSGTTTTDSHLRLDALAATPSDLHAPIDYAAGTAYVRLEVFTKPTDVGTRFQVCFEASPTYACTDQAPTYTTTGVYTWATPFASFYQGDMVDWSRGLGRVALILKDTMNGKPSPENVGAEISARYMPTQLRVTVTLVSPGGVYEPPSAAIDGGVADAGLAIDAGAIDADASVEDAEATRDLGARDAGRDATIAPSDTDGGCAASGRRAAGGALGWAVVAIAAWLARRRRGAPNRRHGR